MNGKQTRQYEMFLRVRDVVASHRDRFDAPAAIDAIADLTAIVEELAATHLAAITASDSARGARKAAARAAINDLLLRVNHTEKVLRARGRPTAAFALPSPRTDQTLLVVGRRFARDAMALEAEFTAFGMPPSLIDDTASAFDRAIRDRSMSRADFTAARARTRDLLTRAFDAAHTLDVVIDNQLAGDHVIQAVWKQARHVEDPYRSRATGVSHPHPR